MQLSRAMGAKQCCGSLVSQKLAPNRCNRVRFSAVVIVRQLPVTTESAFLNLYCAMVWRRIYRMTRSAYAMTILSFSPVFTLRGGWRRESDCKWTVCCLAPSVILKRRLHTRKWNRSPYFAYWGLLALLSICHIFVASPLYISTAVRPCIISFPSQPVQALAAHLQEPSPTRSGPNRALLWDVTARGVEVAVLSDDRVAFDVPSGARSSSGPADFTKERRALFTAPDSHKKPFTYPSSPLPSLSTRSWLLEAASLRPQTLRKLASSAPSATQFSVGDSRSRPRKPALSHMAAKHQSVTESVMAAAPRSLPARRAYPDADRRELLQEPSLMQQPAEDPPFKTLVSLLNSSWMASDVFQRSGEQALADQSLALAEDKNPKSGTTGVASEFLQMLPLFPIASEPALFVDLRTFAIRMCGMSSKPWNEKPKFEAGAPPTKDESTQLDSSHMYRNVEHDRADVDEATLQVISIDWSAIRQVKRAENPPWRDNSWHSSSGPENGTDLKSVRDSARVSGAQTTASYTSHSLPWDSQVRKSSGSPLPQETILPSQSGQNKETGVFLNRGPPEAVVKSRPTVVAYGQAPGSTDKLVPRVTLNAQSPSSLSWSSNNTRQPDNGGPSTRDGRLSSVAATFASAARAAEQATSEADQLDVNFSYSPPSEAPGSERERLHGEGKLPGAPEKHGWIALLRCIRKREDGAEEKVNAASIERSGQTLSAGSSNAPEAELLVENALLGLVPVHLVPAPKAVQNHILKSTKAGHDSRGDLHASTGGLGEGANNDSDSERSSGFMPSSREGIVSDLSPRSINPFLNTAPRHAVLRWAAPEARAWVEGMLLSRGRLTQDHALRKDSPVFAFTSASEPGNQMIPDGEKRRHASEHEQHPRARRIQQTNHKEKRRESGDAVPRWSHLSGYLRKDKQPADEGGEGGVELPVWVLDVPIHKIMEVRNNGKSSPDCSLRAGMRQTGTPPNAANMDGLPAACGASAFWHPSVGRPLSAQLHLDGFREQCRLLRRRSAERNGTAEQTKSPVGNAGRTKYPSCGTDLQDMDMIVMLAGVESSNPRDTDERADARSKAALSRLRFPPPSTVPKEQSHSKWTETLTNDSSRKTCGTSPMHVAEHGEDTLWVKCYRGWPETLHTVSLTGPELSLGDDIPIPVFMGGFTSNR